MRLEFPDPESHKVGDSVYYIGLYWDCRTPPIDLNEAHTVIEVNGNKVVIELDGVKHTVYSCELSSSRRSF